MTRIESGVVQFGDDWPGVFFRGDTAVAYAHQLRRILEDEILRAELTPEVRIALAVLRNLMAELQACDVRLGLAVTQLRPAEECQRAP